MLCYIIMFYLGCVTSVAAHKLKYSAGGSASGVPQDCSALPGAWTGGFSKICGENPIGDSYSFNWTQPPSPGAWTATEDSGGGWGTGKAQNSADNSTTVIVLDSDVTLHGNITSTKAGGQCSCILWDNGSWWMKQGPPPPPITYVTACAINKHKLYSSFSRRRLGASALPLPPPLFPALR